MWQRILHTPVSETSETRDSNRKLLRLALEATVAARAAARTDQQVVQTAGEVNNVFISHGTDVRSPEAAEHKPGLAERRQEFHFDVLKLKMKHAQWMIFISVFAVAVGVVAMVAGVVMALANTGSPHGYVTGASGLAASLGGGALHRHAKRAMADLTEAAKRNEDKIDVDHQIEVATTLIDRIGDKDLKDRLNSAAALKALNIHPNPDTLFNSLLPADAPKEIEPGDSDR
ncbi:hypothetical protein GCM10011578_067560 [Streptomyces fuscichromogenes]|uniref:Cyanobacterial TRADD-N associated 2 transmembrane domain-containing protein n=1 Tax=Streptomyces fuscichromogenes TaxID=1324013 RepID=A0A917XIP0_9ACTN|nr:hypothetical protein GCM10011578_067560 [Streptomyces fuscichromogenes]